MAKLLVACFSFNSRNVYGTTYTKVVSFLEWAAEATEKVRSAVASGLETENGFQAILVAPEYMFTGENTSKAREPMLMDERNDLIRDIKAISKKYKDILIFPGSIFYKEALGGSTVESVTATQKAMAHLISAELSGKKMTPRDKGDLMTGWSAGSVSVPGITSMTPVLAKPKADSYRAYNSVQAFLGGEAVIKTPYVKNWDFKETEGASVEKLMYVPGSQAGTRTILGFDFGIEVCFDHANGALKGSKTDVDFHIVVSDWVNTTESKMAMKNGGYFIHASTKPKETTVCYRNSSGTISTLKLNGGKAAQDSLAYWLVEVEKRATSTTTVSVPTGTKVVTPSGKTITGGVKVF